LDSKSFKLSRLAGYTVASAATYLVGAAVNRFLPGSILGVLQDLGFIGLLVFGTVYAFFGLRWLRDRLFWKVRNKIIVSFAFVGIFPLVILLLISSVVLVIIFKRLSGFYLEHELRTVTLTLEQAGSAAALACLRSPDRAPATLRQALEAGLDALPLGLRSTTIAAYGTQPGRDGLVLVQRAGSAGSTVAEPEELPVWVQHNFTELTTDGRVLLFTAVVDVDESLRLVLLLPFDDSTLDYLRRRTAIDLVVTQANPRSAGDEFQRAYAALGEDQGNLTVSWAHFVQPIQWSDGAAAESWSIMLSVPMGILLEHFFARDSGPLMAVAVMLIVAFVLVELVSLFIGISIVSGITRSIHDIYTAVESIRHGNFYFRIPSRGRDQLADMADSFNDMSASIVTLMGQVSQREALEKELEIAKEVQNQLFPQQLPLTRSLEIAASCLPARRVSGDYYDFLAHSPSRLDIVVGDISGKGISAALLMASLQSTIRSGLSDLNGGQDPRQRIAGVVRSVNRQLYRRSSPESFSTLVLNHFDADAMKLYYCNAGHHPPLVFSNNRVTGLTVGGTVVGLFENWEFDAGEISLGQGDLVVYFTDGVVEAVNKDGDQFSTERLIELVRSNTFLTAEDIQHLVIDQVFEWSTGTEQADDITVVCMKIV
jgi:phosphoserine phosphatase RsbU/P